MSSERADFKKLADDPVTYATDNYMLPIPQNLYFYKVEVPGLSLSISQLQSLNGLSSPDGPLSPCKSYEKTQAF